MGVVHKKEKEDWVVTDNQSSEGDFPNHKDIHEAKREQEDERLKDIEEAKEIIGKLRTMYENLNARNDLEYFSLLKDLYDLRHKNMSKGIFPKLNVTTKELESSDEELKELEDAHANFINRANL